MVKKVFWENAYLTELKTKVNRVAGAQITLAETIFYAFSGGQESDQGTIGGYSVLNARKEGAEIYYTLPNDHDLSSNDAVKVIINWERRYRLMRLHFAAEIVLELVYKRFPSIVKVGAHIAEHKARIDFRSEERLLPYLSEWLREAQAIIDEHLPIISAFSDEAMERRYWKIDGFSSVPCGGTHVNNTREVGVIALKRVNPGRGLERIEIFVDK